MHAAQRQYAAQTDFHVPRTGRTIAPPNMASRSKKMGAASRVASGVAPLRAPTPGSANTLSKGTPQVATPQETTFCQYLGSLVIKLDRAAWIPKLIVECGTTINSRMSTKFRNLRLHNNIKYNLLLIELCIRLVRC